MLKNFIFLFIITFFSIFLIEFSSRVAVMVATKKLSVLGYGLNHTDIQVVQLKRFIFDVKTKKVDNIENIKEKENRNEELIWTFGGSTTAGFNCGKDASSWPEELSLLSSKISVINFGRNGADSSWSLAKLKRELAYNTPNVVIWANRVNEIDFIYTGRTSNFDLKQISELNRNTFVNNILIFNKSLIVSLKDYSISILLFDAAVQRLLFKLFPQLVYGSNLEKKLTEKDVDLVVKNYKMNSEKLINLSKKFGFKIIFVTLFHKRDMLGDVNYKHPLLNIKLFNLIDQLSNKENLIWINTIKFMPANEDPEKYFCDDVHQSLLGNKKTAEIINRELRHLYDR